MLPRLRRAGGSQLLLLGLAVTLVFANTFDNSFHFDDSHSLVDNPHIRSVENIPRFFVDPGTFSVLPQARMYRPLLLTSYALNYALHGYDIWGYHLVNLLLHALNVCLVWRLAAAMGLSARQSVAAGLLFAVHPLVSEPVNYISSRSTLLAASFVLGGFGFLLGWGRERSWGHTAVGAALCQAGALGAKAIGITLPLSPFLLWPRPSWPTRWRILVPLLALCGLYLVATRALVGRAVLEPVRPLAIQWATQVKAAVFYLFKVVMPVNQSVEPQFSVAAGLGDWPVALAALVLASCIGLAWRPGAGLKLFVFGCAWFCLNLLPTAFVPLHILVNEHRLYLPLAGICWAVVSLPCPRLALVPLLLVLGLLAGQRNQVWLNEQTLWSDAVAKGEQMARPHINLGKAFLERGEYELAIASSQRGLALNPGLARAHFNIGTAYLHLGQLPLAVASLERALELQGDLIEALTNLANAHIEQEQPQQALPLIRRALVLLPSSALWHNLGAAHLAAGAMDSANSAFRRALLAAPENMQAHLGLIKTSAGPERGAALEQALAKWPAERVLWQMKGDHLAHAGQDRAASEAYRHTAAPPSRISLWLGLAARRRGDWLAAQRHFEASVGQKGAGAAAHNALGEAYVRQGRLDEGLGQFKKAALVDGQMAAAFANIGAVYLKQGNALQAAAALQRAVQLAPQQGAYWSGLSEAQANLGKIEASQEAARAALTKGDLAPGLEARLRQRLEVQALPAKGTGQP